MAFTETNPTVPERECDEAIRAGARGRDVTRLLLPFADTRDPDSLASKLRRRRFAFFNGLLAQVPRPVTILDVGGNEDYWRVSGALGEPGIEVTMLNVRFPDEGSGRVRQRIGDARSLDFENGSFDIVFSNSVIEHVGDRSDQLRMAAEIQRVGARFFVQTPNFYFPIEPHFLFPGFQWLPGALRAEMLSRFDLGWTARIPDKVKARELVDSIQLLRRRDFASYFPGASIYDERFLGFTKSFTAYGGF